MSDPDAAGQVHDPFAAILGDTAQPFGPPLAAAAPQPIAAPTKDPFSDLIGDAVADPAPDGSSASGAFVRGAVRGVLPAAGGLAAALPGAEAGGEAGLLFGPWGAAAGALIGGLAGGFGGSYVAGKAQDYALSKAPDSWVEALGQDDRQQRLDQEAHPYASFMGGLLPFALTMKPGGFTKPPGWENFTGLQRIMSNPVLARVFGGAMVGGIELGQEASEGNVDWRKVAISTAFGLVFNKPNRIGEAIEGSVPRLLARIAEAADAKVAGPGVTKEVFLGSHQQDPVAEGVAQDAARTDASIIGPKPEVSIEAKARAASPDLFAGYDELHSQQETLRRQIDDEPENEQARQHLASVDRAIEDVAPKVESALRSAAERAEAPTVAPTPPIQPYDRAQWDFIAGDVARKFAEAGRPQQEADLLGQVAAANMATLARDFEGKIGTAEEIYRREGAEIRGERGPPTALIDPTLARETAARLATAELPQTPTPIPAPRLRTKPPGQKKTSIIPPIDVEAARAKAERLGVANLIQTLAGRGATPDEIADTIGRKMTRPEIAVLMPKGELPTAGPEAGTAAPEAARDKAKRLGIAKLVDGFLANRSTPAEVEDFLAENMADKKMTAAEIEAMRPAPQKLFQGEALPTLRMAANRTEQDALLRASWEQYGLTRDYTDLPDPTWRREVAAWNGTHGTEIDPENYKFGSVPDFEEHLKAAHPEKREPFPGIRKANDFFEEQGEQEHGVYLAGQQPEEWNDLGEPGPLLQGRRGDAMGAYTPAELRGGQRGLLELFRTANATTAIHELGHDFLERLKRYASHPDAPPQLRADWATLRHYASIGEDGAISRDAHEKVANVWMRYLSEGRTPSRSLAAVFERFKGWLTALYDTVRGFDAPINDDLRRVFDRWLNAERPEAVVAPEGPRPQTLADLHAEDVARAEHPEAAADRIAAERAEPPPREVANEIAASVAEVEAERAAASGAAEPGREAGHGGERSAEVEHGGGKAGSEPGGGGVGGESGAQRAGGTETPTESGGTAAGASAAGRSDAGDPLRNTPLAPRPAEFLTAPKRFVDKAGNIRLDNVNDADDIKAAMREVAAANNDFIGDRRAIVTDKQAETTAEQWGDERITRKIIGEGWSAEENLAVQRVAAQAAHDSSMAAKTYAASGSVADLLVYAEKRSRHVMMQAYYARATAESGRALRALRKVQEYWTPEAEAAAGAIQAPKPSPGETIAAATGRTLYQLAVEAKLLAAYDKPNDVARFIGWTQKHTFGRMILEYWINGLISGTATHTTYVIGNTLLSLEKGLLETPVAAAIGALRGPMGRDTSNVVRFGEVAERLRGIKQGYAPAATAALQTLRTGVPGMLPGQDAQALPFQSGGAPPIKGAPLNEQATMADVKAGVYAASRGILDSMVAIGKILEAAPPGAPTFEAQWSPLGATPDVRFRGGVVPIGQLVRLPSRAIASVHTFFNAMNGSMEKHALIYRQAANEGDAKGWTQAQRIARMAELTNNTPEAMMVQIARTSREMTLMGPAGEFTRKLMALTNWAPNIPGLGETPVLKFIDPFVHIASNIIDQSIIQRTPVGLLSGEIRRDLMGTNGPAAQDMAQARMIVGTALALGFGTLAAKGLASGSGPMDRDKAAMWRLAGNQAHSVRIGDVWYQTNRLGPLGMLLGISADLYDVAHAASQGDMLQAAAYLQHAITQNVLDESFMRGPADLIQAAEDPGRYGERYVQNFASSFLPYSVAMAQMDRATDPFTRQARTVMEAIKQKIPGQSETLFPRRDVWGNEIPNHDALVAAGLTAIYESQMSRDPVNIALADMGIGIGPVDRTIRNVQLTEQQYDDFARVAGVMLKRRLDVLVNSPDWRQRWTIGEKADLIKETLRGSRETAEGWMFGKYPSILAQATRQVRQKYAGAGFE